MTTCSSLHFQLPAGQAPEWVHLTPAGTFSGGDGRGPYTLEAPDEVIRASMAVGKFPIDENHSTDTAAPAGRPSPARGWVVEMQLRDDGLWGRVDWTATGKRLVEEHEYRGISPVLLASKAGGRVLQVLRAALTNDPNLPLATLHSRTHAMDLLTEIRTALGLPATADQAAVIAGVKSVHSASVERPALLKRLAEAAGAKAEATADEIVTHLHATRSEGDAVKTLRETVITLQSKLDNATVERAKEKATQVIDQAIKDGRPLVSLRDHYIERHQKDPVGVEKEIAAMPSIHDGGIKRPPPEGALAPGATTAEVIAAADKHQAEQATNGNRISSTDAILHVTGRR